MNRIHRGVGRRHHGELGVSLLSLFVVLLSLGALSAIAIAAVNSGQTNVAPRHGAVAGSAGTSVSDTSLAGQALCEASATAIESAALAYFVGHDQTWPADIATLTGATPPYLKSAPNPKWGLVYDNTTGNVDASPCNNL